MRLTDEDLLKAPHKAKSYKIYDGKGLFVEVPSKGNIRWRFKYRFEGKEKKLSLGIYPAISISQARQRLKQLKLLLDEGIDPALDRKTSKANHRNILLELEELLAARQYNAKRIKEYEEYTAVLRTTLVSLKDALRA